MNRGEKAWIIGILTLVALLVTIDIASDLKAGAASWHLATEVLVGVVALAGILYLLRGSAILKQSLARARQESADIAVQAAQWRSESRKYIEGLSQSIDEQLIRWNLTLAEKEVAFLLLKGLSLKEIAVVRNTSERTSRVQSIAIYEKAGIQGRSGLAAFFLEDLLGPGLAPESGAVRI